MAIGRGAGSALLLSMAFAWAAWGAAGSAEQDAAVAELSVRAEAGDAEAIDQLIARVIQDDSKASGQARMSLFRARELAFQQVLEAFRTQTDPGALSRLARVLGSMGYVGAPAIGDLRQALSDPDAELAGAAAQALGAVRGQEARADLVRTYVASRKLVNQRSINAALLTLDADQLAREARLQLVASLAAVLASDDPEVRRASVEYVLDLYRAERDDQKYLLPTRLELEPLVPEVARYVGDPEEPLTFVALQILEFAGPTAAEAVPVLVPMLEHERARHLALRALQLIDTPAARAAAAQAETEARR